MRKEEGREREEEGRRGRKGRGARRMDRGNTPKNFFHATHLPPEW